MFFKKTVCSICDKECFEFLASTKNEFIFCTSHKKYSTLDFIPLATIKISPDKAEDAVKITELKQSMFRHKKIPTLLRYEYKDEEDAIHSIIKLLGLNENREEVQEEIKKLGL